MCLDVLVLEQSFNPKAAPTFLRVYDETIAFAGLTDSDKISVPNNVEGDGSDLGNGFCDEDERELTTGLLSKDSGFRLIVSGKIGAKEIDRLIAKLELDKEILAEEDSDETL